MNDTRNGPSSLLCPSRILFLGSFDDQVHELLSAVRLKKQDVESFTQLFNDLENNLRMLWPGCQVMPFGSVVSGLGIISSDVDCYVELPQNIKIDQKTCVILAKKVLQRNRLFRELFAITAAKVAIVKFYHVPTSTYCDVSFKSPTGVKNSNLLGFILQMDPRALPLAVIIKYWAKVHKFTGTNFMSSYCLILLVIFYLQQKNILPTIYILQSTIPKDIVDGWNTAFDTTITHRTSNHESLYDLLGGFFNYYTNFNWAENIISPYTGYMIKRSQFSDRKTVPELFEDYIRNIEIGHEKLRLNTTFCVQDFFQHNRNCSAVVYPRLANTILIHFKSASQAYQNKSEGEFLKEIFEIKPFMPILNQSLTKKKKKKTMQPNIINKGIIKAKHKTNNRQRRDFINEHTGYRAQGFNRYQNIHRR